MRLWLRYFREKRIILLLYFTTVFLFVAVGSLYHIANLGKLLYAFCLTFVLWGSVGVLKGLQYVKKSKKTENAIMLLEKTHVLSMEELFPEGWNEAGAREEEGSKSLEGDGRRLLSLICDGQNKERSRWEEQAAERKDYFLMWTHQIKTPISAMKLLLEGEDRQDKENFLMREELFKIEQYVEMVLSYQRLEDMSRDMVLQEYKLFPLLKQSVKKYAVLFINKNIRFVLCETAVSVLTDEKWFAFCFEQIFSNSIKYTEQGEISVSCAERGEKVVLQIADTGLGIRAEDLPRIFEQGFTGYNGRMDKKATGIGLYLCKRICEQLGIEIAVESTVGVGTTVTLSIPETKKR